MKKGTTLYEVRKDVKCLNCGNKGAILVTGKLTATGKFEAYVTNGIAPYYCLNCENSGAIDYPIEGLKVSFQTIKNKEPLSELEKLKLVIKGIQYYYRSGIKIPSMRFKELPCGHVGLEEAPCCKNCVDSWISQYTNENNNSSNLEFNYKELMQLSKEKLEEKLKEIISKNIQ